MFEHGMASQQKLIVSQFPNMKTEIKDELRQEFKAELQELNEKVDFILAGKGSGVQEPTGLKLCGTRSSKFWQIPTEHACSMEG